MTFTFNYIKSIIERNRKNGKISITLVASSTLCFIILFSEVLLLYIIRQNMHEQHQIFQDKTLNLNHLKNNQMNDQISILGNKVDELIKIKSSTYDKQLSLSKKLQQLKSNLKGDRPLIESIKGIQNISKILSSKSSYELIEKWTNCSIFSLCYQKSLHGLSPKKFHQSCDGLSPTLTLIETDKREIYGGFTFETWEGNGIKYDNNAFIFNFKGEKLFKIIKGKPAVNVSPDLFPSFGRNDFSIDGNKIILKNKYDSFDGFTLTYSNPKFDVMDIISEIHELEVFSLKCT